MVPIMVEEDHPGKIPPGQTLLLAEPIFQPLNEEDKKQLLLLPPGSEKWVSWYKNRLSNPKPLADGLLEEYVAIGQGLRQMRVPFHMILAHRDKINEIFFLGCTRYWGVRGLALSKYISSTCFPRDMMVDFDGQVLINPDANFNFPDNSGAISRLGEGGAVLKLDKKVFVPDPIKLTSKERQKYRRDIRTLSSMEVAFLPWPAGWKINLTTGKSRLFASTHLDRVAALVRGRDGEDHLLVDNNYLNDSKPP